MDLDDLRDALNEAGSRIEVDEHAAREAIAARSTRRPNRRVSLIVAIAAAIAVVVASVAAMDNRHGSSELHIAPTGPPPVYSALPPHANAALAYDAVRSQVVLFGGEAADTLESGVLDDTWTWDGNGWSDMHPSTSPPAREGAAMAYDVSSKSVILFGGTQPNNRLTTTTLNDTWIWDGTTWTQRHPLHQPPGGTGLAMSYDPRSRSMVLLTEAGAPSRFATWSWNGTDWRRLATPSAPLFEVNGAGNNNPRLVPLANGGGLLFYSWAVFDGTCPAKPGGGSYCDPLPDPNGTRYSQTWTWDGTRWTKQDPTHAPALAYPLIATPDAAGPTAFDYDGSTWQWTGADWQHSATRGDAPRLGGTAVYDQHDGTVVAYAQRIEHGPPGSLPVYDTWTWDGTTWTDRIPLVTSPTTSIASSTTIAPTPDPLPAGSIMLGISGRTIAALDAHGRKLKTLVTAFLGRTVVNARLMPDHRTIWYATKANDNQSCPEVVQLDLHTNHRTVVAHASDFSLTPDGSKLLLVWPWSAIAVSNKCLPVPYPSGVQVFDGALVVRDLTTGAQSALAATEYPSAGTGGPTGHVWISSAGDFLISANCTEDGCGTITFVVPPNLNGPIVRRTTAGPACGCSTLVSGPDGVYGVDEGSFKNRQTALRRYDAANLTGPGTVVVAPTDVTLSVTVAPTADGVFVPGIPTGSKTAALYRVDNGALQLVTTSGPATVSQIFAIPPFAAG